MATANKTRIATQKIIMHREGKRVTVKANEKFDFTPEEIESIRKQNEFALRMPVNEEESAPQAKTPVAPEGSKNEKAGQMAKPNGKVEIKGDEL